MIWPLAVAEWATIIPIAIGVFGAAGVIFTALRYNREDTTAVVSQQTQILGNMKTLNDELRITADGLRSERDNLREQVQALRSQVAELSVELRVAHARQEGQLGRIEDKLDDG